MARVLFSFLSVFIVVGGLYRNMCAQDRVGPKPSKTKLFEVSGFGGKISQGTLGGALDALRDKKVQQEIGLLPAQFKELVRLNEEVMKELAPIVEIFSKLSKAEQADKVDQLRTEV